MVKSKVVYILVILTLIAALCAASVSAAETRIIPMSYAYYYTLLNGNRVPLSTGTSLPFPSNGTQLTWTREIDGTPSGSFINSIHFATMFQGESSAIYFFQPEMTYRIKYVLSLTPNAGGFSLMNVSLWRFNSYLSYTNDYDTASSQGGLIDLYQYNYVGGLTDVSGNAYTVEVAFRTSSSFNGQNMPFLQLYVDIPVSSLASGSSVGAFCIFSMTSVEAFYDPEGDVMQDMADQIVAGQRETAEAIIQGQKDAIIEGQERERAEVESEASSASDDANADAESAFSGSTSILSNLRTLYNTIGYEGTDFNFTFPAAHDVPYVGDLWDEQSIPFQYYIDILPQPIRSALVIIIFVGGIAWAIHIFKSLLSIINGGKE